MEGVRKKATARAIQIIKRQQQQQQQKTATVTAMMAMIMTTQMGRKINIDHRQH